jgi:hypothetical protein
MALTFTKTKSAAAAANPTQVQSKPAASAGNGSSPSNNVVKLSGGVTFLKKGAAAKAAVQAEEVKFEERRAEMNRMRRFYIGYNKDTQITFLDGKLDEDGVLDIPRFYEHSIQVGSDWKHYVCTAEIDQSQPCPLCEAGNKPSLVGVMTVIDHSEYTVQKGPNAGKVYKNQRRLFVAKEGTLKDLNKLAAKPERNGLAGCTFDVSRGGENTRDPNVGKTYDFVCKNKTLAAIAEKYGLKIEEVQPAQYDGEEGEILYVPPEKLVELGLGKAHGGVGYEKGVNAAANEL